MEITEYKSLHELSVCFTNGEVPIEMRKQFESGEENSANILEIMKPFCARGGFPEPAAVKKYTVTRDVKNAVTWYFVNLEYIKELA